MLRYFDVCMGRLLLAYWRWGARRNAGWHDTSPVDVRLTLALLVFLLGAVWWLILVMIPLGRMAATF